MSYEVNHAIWHFWQPGLQATPTEDDMNAYQMYLKKASKRNSDYRLLLLALAFDANAIEDVYGESSMAMCYPAIETLMERVQRSRSTVQRLIRELTRWGEIECNACDGKCNAVARGRRHAGTHHYYIPLPLGAEPWGRKTKGQIKRGRETRRHASR